MCVLYLELPKACQACVTCKHRDLLLSGNAVDQQPAYGIHAGTAFLTSTRSRRVYACMRCSASRFQDYCSTGDSVWAQTKFLSIISGALCEGSDSLLLLDSSGSIWLRAVNKKRLDTLRFKRNGTRTNLLQVAYSATETP